MNETNPRLDAIAAAEKSIRNPCPFCGHTGIEIMEINADPCDGGDGWKSHCESCHAHGPMQSTPMLAANAWNIMRQRV